MIRVFKRSATSFEEFASARKITVRLVNTPEEAIALCDKYNENRNSRQIKLGTKLEWEKI